MLGGTAFIGPFVVRRLVARDQAVTVFHRGVREADLPGVQHWHGDRHNMADLTDAVRRLTPDVVIDMAPMAERDALATVTACAGHTERLIALSSEDVYRAYGRLHRTEPGPPDPVPLTEDAPLREQPSPDQRSAPRPPDAAGPDDRDKILVERVVMRAAEPRGTVLRLPMVYGPGDYQHRLYPFLKRMDDARPALPLSARLAAWRWSRGYVENVAEAVALAATDDRAAGRIYNVAEPEALSMADWVRAIGAAAGWRGRIAVVPEEIQSAVVPIDALDLSQDWVADTNRIRADLGYAELIERTEALRRTVAWEREHPPATLNPRDFDYAAEDALLARLGGE